MVKGSVLSCFSKNKFQNGSHFDIVICIYKRKTRPSNCRVSLLGIPKLYLYRIGKGLKLSIPFPPVHSKKICFFIRPSNSSGAKGSLKK